MDSEHSDLPDLTDEDSEQSEIPDAVWVECPYCGEEVEMLIDVGGGETQEYVEDCEVCCRPWSVRVELGEEGASVEVTTLDEE
jgi:hypothetical protein